MSEMERSLCRHAEQLPSSGQYEVARAGVLLVAVAFDGEAPGGLKCIGIESVHRELRKKVCAKE